MTKPLDAASILNNSLQMLIFMFIVELEGKKKKKEKNDKSHAYSAEIQFALNRSWHRAFQSSPLQPKTTLCASAVQCNPVFKFLVNTTES